ncbi:MAG: FHA domain-containing protein [Planctomycetota bacterium]|nr:MAG: FHA domain-containing protein [Planctomycetota bacterium]
MSKLVVKKGLNAGVEYHLSRHRMTIGRAQSADIRLRDTDISRQHAAIEKSGDGWSINDLGSSNGITVNGKKMDKHPLASRDEIKMGKVTLVYLDSEDTGMNVAVEVMPEGMATDAETDDESKKTSVGVAPARKRKKAPKALIASGADLKVIDKIKEARTRIISEIHKIIIGQDEVIEQLVIALFSRGHCMIEGVPGLAKTLMVSTLAQILDLDFKRIQFTPDLMPADITGTDVLEEDPTTRERSFKFIKGPVFTNVLLADEINRTPPKTQAALLEAMQEYRVTASGYTYKLEEPFFVLATMNPIEQEGTYPLPEAQLDRFMFKILIRYPTAKEEVAIVEETTKVQEAEPGVVLSGTDIMNLQIIVRKVPVSRHVVAYATSLARATRPGEPEAPGFVNEYVAWGAGPRAAQYLVIGAKARAVFQGRYNVSCADVRAMAHPVMRHRVFVNFNAESMGKTPEDIVQQLLEEIPEPEEE